MSERTETNTIRARCGLAVALAVAAWVGRAEAAVAYVSGFSSTPLATSSPGTTSWSSGSLSVTPGAGTNRVLLVVVTAGEGGTGSLQVSGSYNGTGLTQALLSPPSSRNQVWIGYVKEANLPATGAANLSVTVTTSASMTGVSVFAGTYQGVNQTTPITGTGARYNYAAAVTLASSVTSNAGGAYVAAVSHGTSQTLSSITPGTFTAVVTDNSGHGVGSNVQHKLTASAATDATASTLSGTTYQALGVVSLNPAPTVTLGNNTGTEASNATVCAAAATPAYIDYFTLQASQTGTTVTGITATFTPAIPAALLSSLEVTNNTGAAQGSLANPTGTNPAVGVSFAAPTTATQYRLRITPSTAATTSATLRATVTGVATSDGSQVAGNDSGSATIVVDGQASPNVTGAGTTATSTSVTATWTNPATGTVPGTDFGSYVVVLGNTVPITGAPAKGTSSYSAGTAVGADTVVCAGNLTTCQKTGLTPDQTYYLSVFTRDGCANWSSGVQVSATTPLALTIGNGSADPAAGTAIGAGATALLDSFTLQAAQPTTVGEIDVVLTGRAAFSNLSLSRNADCSSPFANAAPAATTIFTGLSEPVGTTQSPNYYVCGTVVTTLAAATTVGANLSGAVPTSGSWTVVDNDTGPTLTAEMSIAIGNAADPTNTAGPGDTAAIDAFTLRANTGTPSVTALTVALTNPAALSSVFLYSNASCTWGTQYGGTVSAPGSSVSFASITNLTASTTARTVYVCGRAATVGAQTLVTAAAVGGTSGTTSYVVVGGGDVAGSLTVVPDTISILQRTDPTSSVVAGQTAAIDAFALSATGTSTVSSVTVTLTNSAALTNVFLYSTSSCTLGTQYGTGMAPAASVTFANTNIGTSTTAQSLWVCGTAAGVTTSTPVTAVVASATTSTAGFQVVSPTGDTPGTLTVTPATLDIGNATVTAMTVTAGQRGVIDGFTLSTPTTGATIPISSVTVTLDAGAAALTNVSISSSGTCSGAGTTYGTLGNPVQGANVVPVNALSVAAGAATTLYVCGRADTVPATTVVTATVTDAAVAYVRYRNDTAGTLTITAPSITIANVADATTSVTAGQVGRIDAFSLQAAGTGVSAELATITVSVTNGSALQNLFINSASSCAGQTYGTVLSPGTGNVAVTVGGLYVTATPTAYYVCGTAAGVATRTDVTARVAGVSPGTIASNGDLAGTLTVNPVTLTIGNGSAEPASTSVTAGQVGAIDAFSLQVSSGTTVITSLTVTLGGSGGLANLFVNASAACTGTTYGALTAPGGTATIPVAGILATAGSGTTDLYLCGTAATVASTTAVTARVTSAAPGVVVANDTTSATLTVTPPVITIGNGSAEPPNARIYAPAVGAIDAFSLQTVAGTATLSTVTVKLTAGASALTSLFVSASASCSDTYGTITGGIVVGPNVIPVTGLTATPASGTTNLYVCGRAATVAVDTPVTGNVSAVANGTVTDADTTNATLTVAKPIPATTTVAIAASVASCREVDVSASFTGDTDANNTVTFARSTDGTTFTNLAACTTVGGGTNPRPCVDATAAANTSYWYRATFADPGTVIGTNPLVSARVNTGACAPSLALSDPGQPAAAALTIGAATWTPVMRFTLRADRDTVTLGAIAVGNVGSPAATANDLQLNLTDAGGSVVYSTARWDGTRWVFGTISTAAGEPIAVGTAATTFGIYATATYGATAGERLVAQVSPAGVVGLSPSDPTTGVTVTGQTFTVSAPSVVDEGATVDGSAPLVSIVNPEKGKVVNGDFLVQVYVFDPDVASPVSAVRLTTDGSTPSCATNDAAFVQDDHAYSNPGAAMYAKVLAVSSLSAGTHTLKACARNGHGTIVSAPVTVTVRAAGTGDGNLLVRDNASQLCTDCHDQNRIRTHSSETVADPATKLSKYGTWATTCRDCHTPHGTHNLYLVKEQIVPPAVNGYLPAKDVYFATRAGDSNVDGATQPASSSYTNADATGPCQVCHTRTTGSGDRWRSTGNQDLDHYAANGGSGTAECVGCHAHTRGFRALESKGNELCRNCHIRTANAMAGSAAGVTPAVAPKASKHSLVGYVDTYTDAGGNWAGVTTYLQELPASQRSCVNMCHQDHVHNWPPGTQSPLLHEPNVAKDASSLTARAVTRSPQPDPLAADYRVVTGFPAGAAGNANTDFDATATNKGLCVSCHRKAISATKPAVDGTAYAASAHNATTTSDGTNAYVWEYRLHDDTPTNPSRFDRNCTKCHASRAEGNSPLSGGLITAVHGTDDPNLLAGATNPGATPSGYVCYNCHGGADATAVSAGTDRSGKNLWAATRNRTYFHPVNSDATHDSAAEITAGYASGRYVGPNRHANCIDCHDSHAAGATLRQDYTGWAANRSDVNEIPPASPMSGASGVVFGWSALAGWGTPAAGNFTWTENATYQYEVCFKCHSSYAYGPLAAPYPTSSTALGGSGGQITDVAQEFNPNNLGGHPVVTGLASYPNKPVARALPAGRTLAPWTQNGTQTMSCTDCHDTDTAAPAIQGPHASAYRWFLKGTGTYWPTNASGTPWTLGTSNNTALFCNNCHPVPTSSASNNVHRVGDHSSRACTQCHIAVPHGGKTPRLLAPGYAPAPYQGPGFSGGLMSFELTTSGTGNTWSQTNNCEDSGCYGREHNHPGNYRW